MTDNRPAELDDPERPNTLHAEMCCAICGHEWVAVYYVGDDHLECPRCHYLDNVPVPA